MNEMRKLMESLNTIEEAYDTDDLENTPPYNAAKLYLLAGQSAEKNPVITLENIGMTPREIGYYYL